jgi:hypothetical protein
VSIDTAREERADRWSSIDTVAGLLAAISILASSLGVVWRPVRVIPFAVVLALIAARMSARQERLVAWAVGIAVACWTVGMTVAVITENPLY